MMRGPAEKAKDFKGTLKRLIKLLSPYGQRLIMVLILAIASTVFTIASPKIQGKVINKVTDSIMAHMLLDQMSTAQEKARDAIAQRMPIAPAQAAAPAQGAMPARGATLAPGEAPSMPPAMMKALGDFMALPLISDAADPAVKAKTVRAMIDLTASIPPEALAVLMPQAPGGGAGSFSGSKFTKTQIDLAIQAIETTNGKIDFVGIANILFLLLGLYFISALFMFATGWLMSTVSQKTVYDLRKAVASKLGRLPLKYFDGKPHGEILSRVTNDMDTISTTLQQSVTQAITSVVQIIGFLAMMLSISWQLTLVVLGTLPLYIFATVGLAKASQKYFAAQQKELGKISGHVEEMYSGHDIVKAFGREGKSIETFNGINAKLADSGWKAQFISGIMFPAMNFISNLGYVLISVAGGVWMTKGTILLGDITAFIQYSRQFTQPIIQTANIANIIQSTIACAERVFQVLDEKEEDADPASPAVIKDAKGRVEIKDLAFRYVPETPLIHDLSLTAQPGHTVAIVGPTGAGKTTLVNLLMRFYDIDAGTIEIDGIGVKAMRRPDLRSLFGMVLQDTWLFNGTIRDNIAYGKDGASEDDIVRAAKAAYADHFIRTLPQGYGTVLNEEASNISSGQKQLLTIARAILADPAILILDEATSSVDTRTEVLIRKAMENLMRDRTSFVIAHRLSTIRDAELILVMDRGAIVEQGTHKELLAKGGFYAEIYKAQFSVAPEAESA
jgi:ATP-binding cassette subfamily B protein